MPKSVLGLLDMLLLLLSPLAILMFVVGVIVVIDRTGTHQAFLRRLEQNPVLTQAVVDQIDSDWIVVRFADPNEKEARIGLVKPVYYPPEVIRALKPGDTVNLRYMAPAYESQAVLDDYYAAVQNYLGFLIEPLIILLVAWVVIVRYPDLLFWGFIDDFSPFQQARPAR